MEETTLKTLVEDIYNDLRLLRKLCDNYIFVADYVRFVDVSDEADSFKEVFENWLKEILTVIESIRTKCHLN